MTVEPDWRRDNLAHWDELVGVHLGARGYDLAPLRAGRGCLDPIVEGLLPELAGQRVAHLQCHFGADSLALAQRGADVTGLDFSRAAIAAARDLATALGLADRARFVEADLYDAPRAIPAPHGYDLVFVSWGALCWLPDIAGWARIVAGLLRPGGTLLLAEGHPTAYVFDDLTKRPDGMPGFYMPYFARTPLTMEQEHDYIDPAAKLAHHRTHSWVHPLGDVLGALLGAGLRLDRFEEHDAVTWRMFQCLVRGADRLWRWPDQPWLPLSYSLVATRPAP